MSFYNNNKRKSILPNFFSDMIDQDTEFIPLLSSEDEEQMNKEAIPENLPILPLRNTVLFPGVVTPITANRDKSIELIRDAYKDKRLIGVVAQNKPDIEDPGYDDIYKVGTVAYLIKMLQMPDGSNTVIIQGKKRFKIDQITKKDPYLYAKVSAFDKKALQIPKGKEFNALISSIKDLALQIIKNTPTIPTESAFAIKNIESPVFLVNFISSNLNIDVKQKQQLLQSKNIADRAQLVLNHLTKEMQELELKNQIQNKVKTDIDKQQRDFFLNQQLKTIQEELGGNPNDQEVKEIEARSKKKKWGKEVKKIFEKELNKLRRMNPAAAEYSIQLNYLDVLVDLPWNHFSKDNFDLDHARKVLDEDHYGLEEVKDRIIEYLAVLKLKKDMKSPILCFVGAPGVGKTSLGKSIARALGRNYFRMSLGGLRDEAEIRGHRKTYIGAMPGRIIQFLKKSKSSNPVFVLDEIDKVGSHAIHGDPSSALLEVLDPEQNNAFYDNYLEIEYDLSRILFISTSNTLSTIQPALRDRMEIIELSGYLLEEKVEIAMRHLIPKQLKEHGVLANQIHFSKRVIESIIENYTRESGVRNLERIIAKVIRYKAKFIAMEQRYEKTVKQDELIEILGPSTFEFDKKMPANMVGVVTGLAWTSAGGQILFIEASLSKGKGQLTLTGNLGDVMKESATLAYEYIKSNSEKLGISENDFTEKNVHIHVPEGATPKDGPSAGIAMFTALASVFSGRKIRSSVAMTGEITLRGKVLPVGGIKEKILAAKRAKVKEIILSEANQKDLIKIKDDYLKGLKFHFVKEMAQVADLAMDKTRKR